MKKLLICMLALVMMLSFAACDGTKGGDEQTNTPGGNVTPGDNNTETLQVMTYDEYMAAELQAKVKIEAYVQATQSWWDNKITVYAADEDGAYFIYELACSEADAAKLTAGTKICVTGYKAEWSGEIEIVDATFEFVEADPYIAEATDVTSLLGTESIIDYQNQLVTFSGLFVKAIEYKGGSRGDDIYVTLTYQGVDYDFCVERYLTGPDSEVYQAVEALQVGDVVDVCGFLYWYNGVNTHITKISKAAVMSYAEYCAADLNDRVVVDMYVQANQSWWSNKITVYAADANGGYFLYEMACTEADAAKITKGAKIRVAGYKAEWSGEVEIIDCHFIALEADAYVAEPVDVTSLLGTEELVAKQNQLVKFSGLTVKEIEYKNGERGDDIYVTFSYGEATYEFCVERYLTGPDTEVYQAVEALKAGDVVDVTGFLYWYNGPNTHITAIEVK